MPIVGNVVAITLVWVALSQAQGNVSPAKLDLLAGRLTISGPPNAKVMPRPHDIMSAPTSPQDETRVVIDQGQQRIVIMVKELFARTDADFLAAATKETNHWPMRVKLTHRTLSSKLQAVEYVPETPTVDQAVNVVMGSLIARDDGSVESLVWYANPAAAKDARNALGLARSMAETIGSGGRILNLFVGEHVLCAYSKTKSVFVTVPAGYVTTAERGLDFAVQHIRRMIMLGDGRATSGIYPEFGLYLGDNPSGDSTGPKTGGTAVIFGQKIEWQQRVSEQGGLTTIAARALIKLKSDSQGSSSQLGEGAAYADVFISANDEKEIEELKSVASTFQIREAVAKP